MSRHDNKHGSFRNSIWLKKNIIYKRTSSSREVSDVLGGNKHEDRNRVFYFIQQVISIPRAFFFAETLRYPRATSYLIVVTILIVHATSETWR